MSSGPPVGVPLDPARAAESNTEWLLGVMGTFIGLAFIFVSLRTYTRAFIVRDVGGDDYIMLVTMASSIAGIVCFGIQGDYGMGKHRQSVSDEDFVTFSKIGFFQGVFCNIGGVGLLKISISLSLLRLVQSLRYKLFLWGLIAFVIAYTIMAEATMIFRCNPTYGYWDTANNPSCYPMSLFITFGVVNTSFNIFTDVVLATIPIPLIWALQMKLRTRLYLIGILSLGYGAVGMGIAKAYYQIGAVAQDRQFLYGVQFWGFLQLNVGIIAACAPALRPLVGRALGLSTAAGYSSGEYYAGNGTSRRNRRSRRHPTTDGYIDQSFPGEYELEDTLRGGVSGGNFDGNARKGKDIGTDVKIYGQGSSPGDRSGSEEMILQEVNGRGIVQTTEISIQRRAEN